MSKVEFGKVTKRDYGSMFALSPALSTGGMKVKCEVHSPVMAVIAVII